MSQPTKNADSNLEREIGLRIMLLRGSESQAQLAEAVGVSREIIQHWERGSRHIKAAHLIALAEHFHVTTDYLLGLSETETNDRDVAAIGDYTGLDATIISRLHTSPNSLLLFINSYLASILDNGDDGDPGMAQLIAEFLERAARSRYMAMTSKKPLSEWESRAYNDMRWAVYTGKTSYDDEKDNRRVQAGEVVLSPNEAASFFTSEATYLANPETAIENVVDLLADGMIEGNENEDT